MLGIELEISKTYLSYQWILDNSNIAEKTIEFWKIRNIGEYKTFDGRVHIEYSSIPAPSRKKLPSKETIRKLHSDYYKKSSDRNISERCYQKLYKAFKLEWMPYRQLYEDRGFDIEKATEYAKQHAVWARIIEFRFKTKEFYPKHIHEAYKRIYPKGYAYAGMSRAYATCQEHGIPALLIKEYVKGNTYAKRFGKEHEAFVLAWISSGKAYSAVTIHDEMYEYCQEKGLPTPCYSWVKSCVARLKPLVQKERYGESNYMSTIEPYAGIIKALNPNTAWQMDGWRLPFHMANYETLSLYGVMDENSGYIIAYDIAPTENTESILRAVNRAVKATSCLPHEIKTDNHSFNQTKEAHYFKSHTDKMGMTWTVDSNPRRKGVVERNLGVFGEKFLKKYPGYLGSGIKSKSEDAHVSQEEKDKYHKANTWITKDEIIYYAAECVRAYNNYVAKKDLGKKKSRKELFENPDQPHKIAISHEDMLRLFIRESEYKVQRGQINIKRELELHEYQLNSEMIFKYNGKQLRVRYEDFDEIYLFDIETDECLGSVKPKRKAHGALADQTDEDINILNQHKGRLEGLKNQIYKAQQSIINPDAPYHVNRIVGKKVEIEALEKNSELQRDFLEHGGDMRFLRERQRVNENNIKQPKPQKTKRDKPFSGNNTIGKVSNMKVDRVIEETSQPLRKVESSIIAKPIN